MASVIHSLCYGFWPLAVTDTIDHPAIVDNSYWPLKDAAHVDFMWKQCDTAVALSHFLPCFDQLLLGMMSVLVGVVPKPHSIDLQLVMNQTAGDFSPNSYIPGEGVAVPLDNLHDLGCCLLWAQLEHGNDHELVLFKSDISGVSLATCQFLVATLPSGVHQWLVACESKQQFQVASCREAVGHVYGCGPVGCHSC